MKIAIVTDSTCDLPADSVQRYGIEVLPLFIQMGEERLMDGVNITKDEFYTRLPDYDPAPTTATPGPEIFITHYEELADKGFEAILSIHISEVLSATINSARTAAKEFTRIPVSVLDSGQLSLGLGFLVEKAARMAQSGNKIEEILESLKDLMPRTYVFAALDTLEYLRRSGRMHVAVARFGEILKLKPLLHMNQGKPVAHRVRTTRRATERLISWLDEYGPFQELAVLHAGVESRAEALREQVRNYLPDAEISIQQITPALGCHLGVGALGFAVISQEIN
ncbi:MAG: DegV family protein [Chloroflexota bacterium]